MQVNGRFPPKSGTEPGWTVLGCFRPRAELSAYHVLMPAPGQKQTSNKSLKFGIGAPGTRDDFVHLLRSLQLLPTQPQGYGVIFRPAVGRNSRSCRPLSRAVAALPQ